MKMAIGFFFGVLMSIAIADDKPTTALTIPVGPAFMLSGSFDDNGAAHMIRMDKDGYVICSDQKKPEGANK